MKQLLGHHRVSRDLKKRGKARLRNGLARVLAGMFLLAAGLVPAHADGDNFGADSRLTVTSVQVLSNTTAIVISSVPATLYGIEASSSILTPVYIKLYNAALATCGSGTPQARYQIPPSTASPLQQSISNGDAYGVGLTACVTGGYADSDTTAPANATYLLQLHWKKSF